MSEKSPREDMTINQSDSRNKERGVQKSKDGMSRLETSAYLAAMVGLVVASAAIAFSACSGTFESIEDLFRLFMKPFR